MSERLRSIVAIATASTGRESDVCGQDNTLRKTVLNVCLFGAMSFSVSLIVHYSAANKIASYILLIIGTAFTIASLSMAVGARIENRKSGQEN